MNKSFIILVVAVIALGAGITLFFMKKTADASREKRNEILNEFKTVDESLKKSALYSDTANLKLPESILDK